MTTSRNKIIVYSAAVVFMAIGMTSCHSSRKATGCHGRPCTENVHIGSGNKMQRRIVEEAMTWVGTPYKYAGVDKGKGVDCSGMVMRVYEDVTGRKLPRNSAKQAEFCESLDAGKVAMGDLVFFATGKDPDKVSHVGIVVDDAHFVHASTSKGVVVSDMTTPYYQRTFKMFGRVPDHANDLATNSKDSKDYDGQD